MDRQLRPLGIFYGHICWHQALGALDRGDAATALSIYRDVLQPSVNGAPQLNAMSDCASLLWRLSADGHAVADALWADAEAYARSYFPRSILPFVEVHMALLAAATGDQAALQQRLGLIERRLADGEFSAGPAIPRIVRALDAFARDDHRTCVGELEPVLADVVRIGGSHAQREIIEDTFIVASIRSGELSKARDLLDRRLHRRPSSRDARWLKAAGG